MYPRRHFFEQASAVMAAAGRSVPVFIDKYLAPSWEDAKWMYDRAQELEIPFMAGSSVPICFWRNTAEGEGCKGAEHVGDGMGQGQPLLEPSIHQHDRRHKGEGVANTDDDPKG